MGCGKSSIGKVAARKLAALTKETEEEDLFCDLDDFVQEVSQRSIKEIFEEDGVDGFRQIEQAALDSALMIDSNLGRSRIIALGGGTLLNPGCRTLVKENAICIYLKAGIETLVKSLTDYPGERPLLENDPRPLKGKIEDLLSERSPFYEECADLTIDTDGIDYFAIADEIIAFIQNS